MKLDSIARYALVGAFAVSLACARNSEENDTSATGRVTTTDTSTITTTDTGATVRVRPDTNRADTARTEIVGDTAGAPVRAGASDSARMTMDSTRMHTDSANVSGPGWPKDSTSSGGWSTPPDSGQ